MSDSGIQSRHQRPRAADQRSSREQGTLKLNCRGLIIRYCEQLLFLYKKKMCFSLNIKNIVGLLVSTNFGNRKNY